MGIDTVKMHDCSTWNIGNRRSPIPLLLEDDFSREDLDNVTDRGKYVWKEGSGLENKLYYGLSFLNDKKKALFVKKWNFDGIDGNDIDCR